ncbi:MAG: hypothetical protein JXA90_04525, partial [Planctomycetes bacterium]|nr:hypothetical protein [Planctomycetota bacterium]
LEVSAVVSFPGLPIPDVSLPTLPVWIGFGDDGANEYSVQALFDLDPRGIIVLDDEDIGTSGTNQLYATGDTREFHWEICVKEYILWLQQNEYARDFLESVPIGWYSPKIVGDVTVRVVPPEGHPEYGTPDDNEETITLSLMLVNPPPVEAEKEWAYSKVLGNDLIGAGLGLQSGAYVTSAAALACASAELDATLFGRTFDNLIDACGRATSLRMTSDPLDTGSLTFRVRNLEFTGGKESHAVLYEKSHDVEFQEGELARVSPTTSDAECRVDSATMNLGRFTYSKSWSKCRQFVVGFVPVGLEIEVGGEVGVSADCEISLERAESKNSVSFMAGPLIAFFAAGNVFVGACPLTEPKSSDGPPRDDDDIDLGDCGKILGATVRLTFVEAQIGPRFWASLGPPESPNPLFDGRAELGAELLFRLTFLEGKVSLWTRFLVPRICWHWGFLPYPCGLKCREIGFNVASFPGFRQDFPVKNLFLQTVDLGNSYGELPDCDVCPQGD